MWRRLRAAAKVLIRGVDAPSLASPAEGGHTPALRAAANVARHPPLPVTLREDVDQAAMAASAATALERVYYAHDGRPMFKWIHYLPLYDRALAPFVGKAPRVLEIGLAQGGSLHLWRKYLGRDATIVGLDLNPDCARFAQDGFPIFIGDQSDAGLLAQIASEHGPFDIVIDDGSHITHHQVASFKALWPHIKPGGVYVCEDLHTNYWDGDWEGGLGRTDTFIGLTKELIDKLHDKYWRGAEVEDATSEEVDWITVADSIAFFHKRAPAPTHMDLVGYRAGA